MTTQIVKIFSTIAGGRNLSQLFKAITDTVLFLFDEEGRTPLGTAFLVGYPSESKEGKQFPLVVTAKHVVSGKSSIIGRYSRKSEAGIIQVRYNLEEKRRNNDFWEHDDDGVDVVVFRTNVQKDMVMMTIPLEYVASKDVFVSDDITVTDRVMFPSLLVRFMGTSRNYPVTRSGTIALIPEEPVPLQFTYGDRTINTMQEVIFVDGTAVQGASGSPVLLWPGPRVKSDTFSIGGTTPWLLGVMHGFYSALPRPLVNVIPTSSIPAFMENSGVAIVFPSWRLLEILEKKEVKTRINELDTSMEST